MIGRIIGNYRITIELAHGGMGTVYRGQHVHLPREIVVKSILLAAFSPSGAEVVGSGAALLRSHAWAQIMADVLGRSVILSAEEEASSRGAALMALEAVGAIEDVSSVPAERGLAFEPDAGRHERYARALDRQRSLYDTLIAG